MSAFELVDDLPGRPVATAPDELVEEFADVLRENPMKWGVYPHPISGASQRQFNSTIRIGRRRYFPAGQFEARSRSGVLYIRYIGAQS